LREEALNPLARRVASFALEDRRARCREGALTFDDLIQLAADLMREAPGVSERVRQRYRALLIDEFQDTDPAQYDIAAAYGLPAPGDTQAGRLFLVGDPKQSIYRFRGADM